MSCSLVVFVLTTQALERRSLVLHQLILMRLGPVMAPISPLSMRLNSMWPTVPSRSWKNSLTALSWRELLMGSIPPGAMPTSGGNQVIYLLRQFLIPLLTTLLAEPSPFPLPRVTSSLTRLFRRLVLRCTKMEPGRSGTSQQRPGRLDSLGISST